MAAPLPEPDYNAGHKETIVEPKREIMDTKKHLEKIKGLVEDSKGDFDKDTLLELGSTALLLLSGFAGNKLIRNVVMGAVIITAGKLAYDYLAKKVEESEKA